MRYLVLGAGLQGSAAAFDLCRSDGVDGVLIADRDPAALAAAAALAGPKAETRAADLADPAAIAGLLGGVDGCFSAIPYFMNPPVAAACAERGVHYVDLGGNTDVSRGILELDEEAKASGATLVPDCGLAPGLSATAAMDLLDGLEDVESLRIRVGGLPADPKPPLGYALFFSIHGLINEYLGEAVVLRDGKITMVPTLGDCEALDFPPPVGRCEACSTLGGTSTLPWTLAGRVRELDYKTVRYPGHFESIAMLDALGFFGTEALDLDGQAVVPRALSARLLEAALRDEDAEDIVVFRVEAVGRGAKGRELRRIEMIDRFDRATGLSAMRRGTAFPASEVLQMLARGEGEGPGARSLELAIPPRPCLDALRRRGLPILRRDEPLA